MIFSGIGNAFNTTLGNTSAYFKKDDALLIIDFGSSVFKTMKEAQVFDQVKAITIVITHTHPDHIGSLGDIILYAFYIMGIKVTLVYPEGPLMTTYLKIIGVDQGHYKGIHTMTHTLESGPFKGYTINFHPAQHVPQIPSYSLTLTWQDKTIYYSGDALAIPKDILEDFMAGRIQRLYQDISASDYPGNVHMPLEALARVIPPAMRSRVYCMHFDSSETMKKAQTLGFAIVRSFEHDNFMQI